MQNKTYHIFSTACHRFLFHAPPPSLLLCKVLGVIDRYERVLERLAEIARRKEEERNKFKLAAERRRLEEQSKAATYEAKRREGLLVLQHKIMAARADPHR